MFVGKFVRVRQFGGPSAVTETDLKKWVMHWKWLWTVKHTRFLIVIVIVNRIVIVIESLSSPTRLASSCAGGASSQTNRSRKATSVTSYAGAASTGGVPSKTIWPPSRHGPRGTQHVGMRTRTRATRHMCAGAADRQCRAPTVCSLKGRPVAEEAPRPRRQRRSVFSLTECARFVIYL